MHYLDLVDEMLTEGLRGLSAAFRHAALQYALASQRPDGGFGGRRGGSDLYYTEFGLRLLTLLDAPPDALARVAGFLSGVAPPRELVDVFSLLNGRRLLAAHGLDLSVDEEACREEIARRRACAGAYGRRDGSGPTAYATFLAALSLDLLGEQMPDAERATAALLALRQPDGGFAQEAGGPSQTNSTSAAVGVLLLENALPAEAATRARAYLATRQDVSGGFSSHGGLPADLLCTFTALMTLVFLDGLDRIDVASVARFVKSCARAQGGFGAHAGDAQADIEYAYYAVGTLALLAGALP
ncbi:hypothetical protein LLH23_15755 [bacterium]|nr:hypothetical protein [bacterium]